MTLLFSSLWYQDEDGGGAGGGGGGGASPKGYESKARGAHVGKVSTGCQGSVKGSARATRCVIKAKYVKAGADAGGSIAKFTKYVSDRAYGPNEEKRFFFDRDGRDYDKDDVIKRMKEQQGEERAMYMVTIAPSGNDLDQTEFTRKFMERFEEHLGVEVDWVAITSIKILSTTTSICSWPGASPIRRRTCSTETWRAATSISTRRTLREQER